MDKKKAFSEILAKLTLMDDLFMRTVFKDNILLAQYVLRILTDNKDLIITSIETQYDLNRLGAGRSVCLDALGTDSSGKKYNIEIQKDSYGADPHRARYHISAMDVDNLDAGEDFRELPDTYVIFITEKDYFKRGEPLYFFERADKKTDNSLNDGTYIIYVNGEYRGDDEIGRLMHDFNCAEPDKMYIKEISNDVREYKETQKGEHKMSGIVEAYMREHWAEIDKYFTEQAKTEARNEGKAEGIAVGKAEGIAVGKAEGIAVGKAEIVLKMLKAGTLSIEQISEFSGLSVNEVEVLKASLQ